MVFLGSNLMNYVNRKKKQGDKTIILIAGYYIRIMQVINDLMC